MREYPPKVLESGYVYFTRPKIEKKTSLLRGIQAHVVEGVEMVEDVDNDGSEGFAVMIDLVRAKRS